MGSTLILDVHQLEQGALHYTNHQLHFIFHFHGFFIWFLKHESSNVYDEKIKETDIMTRNKAVAKIIAAVAI